MYNGPGKYYIRNKSEADLAKTCIIEGKYFPIFNGNFKIISSHGSIDMQDELE
jgi:hypothetical protein